MEFLVENKDNKGPGANKEEGANPGIEEDGIPSRDQRGLG